MLAKKRLIPAGVLADAHAVDDGACTQGARIVRPSAVAAACAPQATLRLDASRRRRPLLGPIPECIERLDQLYRLHNGRRGRAATRG